MADLFNIMKITVGADKLTARVLVNPGMPVRTCEDIEATARVYYLAPAIAMHTCLGDAGEHFQDCMSDTEVAHLLEHLTVEILNETGLAGDVVSGRTRPNPHDPRLFDIELSCVDDALTVGALSSAVFMMQWAFLHPDQMAPDFPGTVKALRNLMLRLRGEDPNDFEPQVSEDAPAGAEAPTGAGARYVGDELPYHAEAAMMSGAIDTEGARAAVNELGSEVLFGGAAEDMWQGDATGV